MGLAKILLFVFNLIFVILGIVVIVSGILIYTSDDKDFDVLVTESSLPFFSIGALTIALGVVIFIVAFTGCCGAIKENQCLLVVFIVLLLLILVLELVVVILGYFFHGKVDDIITSNIQEGMGQYKEDKEGYMLAWDTLQGNGTCCGVDGPGDWNEYGDFAKNEVPGSCCESGLPTPCIKSNDPDDPNYIDGCKDALLQKFKASKDNLIFAGTSSVVILLAEIFGIIFACCVLRDARKDKGRYA